jgi:arylsulfatase A-like enzyme
MVCLVPLAFGFVGAAAATTAPPHIVHFMADDLGYKNGLIRSPNIDRLAMGGIHFECHDAFKVCSPSRASFQSGRMGYHLGLYDNSGAAVPWLKVDNNRMVLPNNFTLLPQLLQSRNYTAHAIGKW